ncbi:hypothetical protein ACW9UR_09760 [Halovulum sp. GXIMD14794]
MNLHDARIMLMLDRRDQNRPRLRWLPESLYRSFSAAHKHLLRK